MVGGISVRGGWRVAAATAVADALLHFGGARGRRHILPGLVCGASGRETALVQCESLLAMAWWWG